MYNNISNDMEFSENVKMDYLENKLFSDKAILIIMKTHFSCWKC